MKFYLIEESSVIEYFPLSRHYSLVLHKACNATHQRIWHCPWCGTKLPEDLGEEWGETLEKEYGITDPFDEDKERVPPEFWTDEWWKKRGLLIPKFAWTPGPIGNWPDQSLLAE